ncbi:MAG: endopeptidase La [Gammaproteobacteria bacterium]|nr:endopeptidase La [Gammaproteobacteria bacterium]
MKSSLPVLPLKDTVVFPQLVVPLSVGRAKSLAAIEAAIESGGEFIAVAQKDPDNDNPTIHELYAVGTIVKINRIERREGGAQVIVQGKRRVKLVAQEEQDGYLCATYEPLINLELSENGSTGPEVDALVTVNRELAQRIAALYDTENGGQIYQQLIGHISEPVIQMYRIASLANLSLEQEQKTLDCDANIELMQQVNSVLTHELRVTELRREIAEQARGDIEKLQREQVLRQQKQAIENALGESSEDEEIAEIRQLLEQAQIPDHIQEEVDREIKRLSRMSANSADYQVARGYLELIAELPWHSGTQDNLDLKHAIQILDEDHYGLEDVKERILETLAVMQLNPAAKAPIICFVGPPGVGKTSLGHSIARAMGRKFERLSLGGLHDESELRGHRRTYIGSMPGRILQALRRAKVVNPILMLDELDKMGRDFRGDPSAALMEILDPQQNKEFRDNYLNLPYDLSKVMFITTANTLEGIPRALLDRMEIMEVSGYSDAEKRAIALNYLIPRQRSEAGLSDTQLQIDELALAKIIRRYTREAGVRELERVFGRIARKRARAIIEGDPGDKQITQEDLLAYLGPEKFKRDASRETQHAGVAAGLAWTESGGDVLYIEATLIPKEEKILLTGHLGQVMQESARAARSYIWHIAESIGIKPEFIESQGIHIHVPAGAVPKDGPSAGVTMATAIASAYSGKQTRAEVTMTGELTLTGLVLPVGGIKEKILAAHRAGFTQVILPKDNEADLQKLPEAVRNDLTFTLAETLDDVLAVAIPDLKSRQNIKG